MDAAAGCRRGPGVEILGRADRASVFAPADTTTLDSLLAWCAALIGVLETLDMEVEHRFEEGLGRQPPEAQSLCEGRGGSGEGETPQAACD